MKGATQTQGDYLSEVELRVTLQAPKVCPNNASIDTTHHPKYTPKATTHALNPIY